MLDNYSYVRLTTDKYLSEGVRSGDHGYVIEVYDGAYEVEFSDVAGNTIAQIVAQPTEVALDEPIPDAAQHGAPQQMPQRVMV